MARLSDGNKVEPETIAVMELIAMTFQENKIPMHRGQTALILSFLANIVYEGRYTEQDVIEYIKENWPILVEGAKKFKKYGWLKHE